MLLLAVDTSSANVSAAVVEIDAGSSQARTLAARDAVAANKHGELLAPAVRDVLAAAGVGAADLAAVAAGLGPGPFTGLRVGIVTVATIADACGIPSYGACSLDAVARHHRGPVVVCSDARRRQVYWASYSPDGWRVTGPDIAPPAELADRVRDEAPRFAGAGALLHRDAFGGFALDEDDPYPRAVDVAHLVAERVASGAPTERLEPMYLRRPDAVPSASVKSVLPA